VGLCSKGTPQASQAGSSSMPRPIEWPKNIKVFRYLMTFTNFYNYVLTATIETKKQKSR
jgi:hypothetical protein